MSKQIFIPTYNRKTFLALKLLKDPTVELTLCVRPELDDEGFYDHLKSVDRVRILRLPYGLTELGESRQAILDYCNRRGIKWCFMADDGTTKIQDITKPNQSFEELFNSCVDRMENDKLSEHIIGMNFRKRKAIDCNTLEEEDVSHKYPAQEHDYFDTVANQVFLINAEKAQQHGIRYKSLKEVGFEDAAFFGDAVKNGLVFCNGKNIRYDCLIANQKKKGGSHSATESLQKKYHDQSLRCMNYLNMYGTRLENRYRNFAQDYLTFIIFNYDYFREVLTEMREQNQQLIDNHFAIQNYEKINDKRNENSLHLK